MSTRDDEREAGQRGPDTDEQVERASEEPEPAERPAPDEHDDPDLVFPGDSAARSPCAQHPEVTSVFTCSRCGDYRCIRCLSPKGSDLCTECGALVVDDHTASGWAIAASVFGFFGVGCAPFGWVGILAGVVDLVLATRSKRTGGRTLAIIGIALGAIGTVLWAYAIWHAMMIQIEDPTLYEAY